MVAPLDDSPSNILFFLVDNQSSIELYDRRGGSNDQGTFVLIPNSDPTAIWSVGYDGESIPQIEDIFSNSNPENGSFIYGRIDGSITEVLRWTDDNLNWELVTEEEDTFYILEITDDLLDL